MKPWQITEFQDKITLEENLGFSHDKVKELHEILGSALDDPNIIKATDVMKVVLDKCKNANEAAYVIFLLGEKNGLTKVKHILTKVGLDHLIK